MKNTYKCPKCRGTGFLSQYIGIASGVCFCCEGNGFKSGAAPVAGVLFAVTAIRRADGARVLAFNVKAKNSAEATKKAVATLARGNGFEPQSAQVAA